LTNCQRPQCVRCRHYIWERVGGRTRPSADGREWQRRAGNSHSNQRNVRGTAQFIRRRKSWRKVDHVRL